MSVVGKNIHSATTIPAQVKTIACQIGKHNLCIGSGIHEDTGENVECECGCHKRKPTVHGDNA